MKLIHILLLALMMVAVLGQDDEPTVDGTEEEAAAEGGAEPNPDAVLKINMKKAQRRTPLQVETDIKSEPDGIVNFVIFYKEDPSNKKLVENTEQELVKYERFFNAMKDESGKSLAAKSFTVDVLNIEDKTIGSLLKLLNIDPSKHTDKRTMTLVMLDGDGTKVWGPTAGDYICEKLLDESVAAVSGTQDDCAAQFEEPKDEPEEAPEEEEPAEGEGEDAEETPARR